MSRPRVPASLRWIAEQPLLSHADHLVLLRAARQGDRKAADKLVRSLSAGVIALALKYRGHDVDELFSAGLLGVYTSFDKYDEIRGASVFTVAMWYAQTAMQLMVRKRRIETVEINDDIDADDGRQDAEFQLSQREIDSRVQSILSKAIRNLRPRERKILRMRYLADTVMSSRQIAKVEGVTYQRIDQILRGALKKITARVEKELGDDVT